MRMETMDDWTEIDMRAQTWAENEWAENRKQTRICQLTAQVQDLSAMVRMLSDDNAALREELRQVREMADFAVRH
jgi:DNA-binding ferritin-like protein